MQNRIIVLILLLLAIAVSSSGCTDQRSAVRAELLTVNSMEDIDAILETSPVFVQIGADWCPSCQAQKPIVEELAAEYGDQIKFVYIDIDRQPQLADQFNAYYIPDLVVIVKSDSGKYIYVTRYGILTENRQEAMMVGLTSKEVLEFTIRNAITFRAQV